MQGEIELLRSLQHPNIVTYLGTDICDENKLLYIFTEWVPGGSIQALVTKFGRLSEAIVRKYVAQLLVGLKYLHEQRVIHRDIKSANILVDDRGTIKLADFGSSKRMDSMGTITNSNLSLRGTPYFMAPEVIIQTGHGRKADIWSVGCTILQMVTGQPPWKNLRLGTPAALMFHIANAQSPPPMPSTLSIELNNLLLATFSRDTRRRPAANDLLKYPFVVANGAAAEANAAESQAAQRSTPLTRSIRGVLMPNQVSAIEDAADHTLACQAIGILSKERDSAEGCFFESFRMPPGDEDPLTAEVDKEGQDVCGYTTPDLRRLGKNFLSSTHSSGVDNEALVTMFFSREAAVQLAGADKHFPGRPPAAQPLGAPQPTPSSQRHDGKIRLREFAAILPSKNHDCDLSSVAHANHRTRKSPLLMANLPRRKQQHHPKQKSFTHCASTNDSLSKLPASSQVGIPVEPLS